MFAYESLVRTNDNSGIVLGFPRTKYGYLDRTNFQLHSNDLFDALSKNVFQEETLQLMEVLRSEEDREMAGFFDLHETLDYTTTKIGSATLLRSLVHPPTDLEYSKAKQKSVEELQANDKLRNAIQEYLGVVAQDENNFFYFLNGEIKAERYDDTHEHFGQARYAAQAIAEMAQSIPQPETPYLVSLVQDLREYGESNIYKMMRGPFWLTDGGLKPSEELNEITTAFAFRYVRASLTPGVLTPALLGAAAILPTGGAPGFFFIGSIISAIAYSNKKRYDLQTVIKPMQKKALESGAFCAAVDAYGKLDELLSFVEYAKAVPHPTTLPELVNDARHSFKARNIRNPILAKEMRDFVPNDLDLEGLTFITGPNSGGKTTICKTIMQSQAMAQIGMPIVAESARIGIIQYGAYQAPMFDSLNDNEGRFGTEHKRTKEIFYAMHPQGIGIFDELSEGTTFDEKMRASRKVMDGFHAIGSNTILVTHNHELVKQYQERGIGQFLQVEFDGENPTHRLISGISTKSHAAIVEERINFTQEDIDAHIAELRAQGIIPEAQMEERM